MLSSRLFGLIKMFFVLEIHLILGKGGPLADSTFSSTQGPLLSCGDLVWYCPSDFL